MVVRCQKFILQCNKMIKYNKFFEKRGMSAVEYSVVIAIVIAALLVMQFYFKRSLSSRWKDTADVFSYGRTFQP